MKKVSTSVRSSSKGGARPPKQKISDQMEAETRKMEEKLELVKKMMDMEKNKRATATSSG